MRAPVHSPFAVQDAPRSFAPTGHMVIRGGEADDPEMMARLAVQAITDHTAGRAQALADRERVDEIAASHAMLRGGAAVASQPHALEAVAQIRKHGQTALGNSAMIAAYDLHVGPLIEDATSRITIHTLQQAQVEHAELAGRELQAAQGAAASAWRAPAEFVQRLAAVQALAMDQLPPDTNAVDRLPAAMTAVGVAVDAAVDQAIAADEPEFAAHILSGWGSTLNPAAYQLAIARLKQAALARRTAEIFAEAAGGNASGQEADEVTAVGKSNRLMIAAPIGTAVHPIAGGVVGELSGPADNVVVQIRHPDGSSLWYGGIGSAAVLPGNLVTTACVIGSARPTVALTATTPAGTPADAAAMLQSAGGIDALIGSIDTPRAWDIDTIVDRINRQGTVTADERSLAISFATRRTDADHAYQSASDLAAGRAAIRLVAATPERYARATDLSRELAARFTPGGLARIDAALRRLALLATPTAPDRPEALRLELLQRQYPQEFVGVDLVQLIGIVALTDLAQLATSQASLAAGNVARSGDDRRNAILDAMARHEIVGCCSLPDSVLQAIMERTDTLVRVDQTDLADRMAIENSTAAAIQYLMDHR